MCLCSEPEVDVIKGDVLDALNKTQEPQSDQPLKWCRKAVIQGMQMTCYTVCMPEIKLIHVAVCREVMFFVIRVVRQYQSV